MFALLCTLFLLIAIMLDPTLQPLCRMTAAQVAAVLNLFGGYTWQDGTLIFLDNYPVYIVPECTPIYACLLYAACVLASPAGWKRTTIGLLAGCLVIAAVNIARIVFLLVWVVLLRDQAIPLIGVVPSYMLFDIAHVYLCQIAMLLTVIGCSAIWLQWTRNEEEQLPVALMAAVYATLAFIPWVFVHKVYVRAVDTAVLRVMSLLWSGTGEVTYMLNLYQYAFTVPMFIGLMLAGRRSWRALLAGLGIITLWHMLYRSLRFVELGLGVKEMVFFQMPVFLFGEFMLPVLLWFWLRQRADSTASFWPDRDRQRGYFLNILLGIDQSLGTLIGIDADESISSYVGRTMHGSRTERVIDWVFEHFFGERDHCLANIEWKR
jgi:exosortase/archaeosortase family protein